MECTDGIGRGRAEASRPVYKGIMVERGSSDFASGVSVFSQLLLCMQRMPGYLYMDMLQMGWEGCIMDALAPGSEPGPAAGHAGSHFAFFDPNKPNACHRDRVTRRIFNRAKQALSARPSPKSQIDPSSTGGRPGLQENDMDPGNPGRVLVITSRRKFQKSEWEDRVLLENLARPAAARLASHVPRPES
jgi:hypothetical protein